MRPLPAITGTARSKARIADEELPADSGLQAGTALTLILTQDGTGSRTGAFQVNSATTNVKWAGGTAPTLTTTASRADIVCFVTFDGGATPTWYGFVAGQDFQ